MNKNVVYTGQTDLKHDSLRFLHITLIIKLQSYLALDSHLVFLKIPLPIGEIISLCNGSIIYCGEEM